MKISLILPTRKRVPLLKKSIDSVVKRTSSNCELEFVFGIDDDDPESLEFVNSFEHPKKIWVTPRLGYSRLHDYINHLSKMCTGEWQILWNDDSIMITPNWDKRILPYEGQTVVLCPNTNMKSHETGMNIFPIVSSDIPRVLGHFSLNRHNDTWMQVIAELLDIHRFPNIFVFHDRADLTGENDDDVYKEREYDASFSSEENKELLKQDALLLREYIRGKDN